MFKSRNPPLFNNCFSRKVRHRLIKKQITQSGTCLWLSLLGLRFQPRRPSLTGKHLIHCISQLHFHAYTYRHTSELQHNHDTAVSYTPGNTSVSVAYSRYSTQGTTYLPPSHRIRTRQEQEKEDSGDRNQKFTAAHAGEEGEDEVDGDFHDRA